MTVFTPRVLAAALTLPPTAYVGYRYLNRNMPSLKEIRIANAEAAKKIKGSPPVAVFVGGTSGIGQGMAEAFGRWTNGEAHIVIVGRNQQAADSILAQLPRPSSSSSPTTWTHEFVQCDATLMKNVHKASKEILQRHPKINFLVMSPGVLATDGRNETEEGIDKKLAVHYYARWKFIDELLPALRKAKEAGEDSKVISVLAAGKGGEVNLDDLGLVKTFSLTNAALQAPTYNDLMMEEYSKRNPGTTFIHSYPGGVKTGLTSKSTSTLIRVAGSVMNTVLSPLLTSQDDCAEYMWSGVFNSDGDGAFRIGSKGEDLKKTRYFGNDEQRQKLWEHTVKTTATPSS
ncbi:NAD(P)-binding protein [Coprinopsis marcescibilis]|uniref:NAD(P)-binding protein n=1 Tax=Coprinopsis marcescibilis TaxID=230819 RepID=A0A5C3KGC7_COPMA|nr:NAD(P)-binding protein [Coprinopsis marcescibilis]